MKGGYQILDLKGTNFSLSTAATIIGAFSVLANAHHKAIMVENYEVGGNKQFASFPFVTKNGASYVLDIGAYNITITSADSVTVSIKESAEVQAADVQANTTQTLKANRKAVTT